MSSMDKYTLKPSLSETFKSIIWKIETDDTESVVAIETRNSSDRISHYSAYNYATGECLFKEVTVEDSWHWSLDRVHQGMVFLHSYVNENHPEHKGIIALNKQGKISWQQFNITLYDITDKGLMIYNPKIQPKSFDLIAAADGSKISANPNKFIPVPRSIIIPDILSDSALVKNLLPENFVEPIFFKKFNDKVILVYHVRNENSFSQQLAVYQDENLILQDNLATDIQKLNPEAFFIERNHMFCIRSNKQQFVSYLV